MRILVCFVTALVFFGASFAQEKVVDEETYSKAVQPATAYLQSAKYRAATTAESCRGQSCVWRTFETNVAEHDGQGNVRVYGFVETPRGMEPLPEYRQIGGKVYVSKQNSGWKVEDAKTPALPSPDRAEAKIEYRDLGIERDGFGELRVFSRTAYVRSSENGAARQSIQITKSWLARDGRYRKMEFYWTDSNNQTRRTVVYEFDPSIKVEPPKM
ncbi:MAG TPA: hypothetical protein VL572_12510 [Pyrinomonadaceae bacterium]|jgi:hypothetical protein|nr:hypothetical protein [Pyrinomonadaceae bacterium]